MTKMKREKWGGERRPDQDMGLLDSLFRTPMLIRVCIDTALFNSHWDTLRVGVLATLQLDQLPTECLHVRTYT